MSIDRIHSAAAVQGGGMGLGFYIGKTVFDMVAEHFHGNTYRRKQVEAVLRGAVPELRIPIPTPRDLRRRRVFAHSRQLDQPLIGIGYLSPQLA